MRKIEAEMILARDAVNSFGNDDGSLPWSRIGWDMRHFREKTQGKVMVMGYNTYHAAAATLEDDDRVIIVLSRNPATIHIEDIPGVRRVTSWDQAAEAVRELQMLPIVCGGKEINESALRGYGSTLFDIRTVWLTEFDFRMEADIIYSEKFADFDVQSEVRQEDAWGAGVIFRLRRCAQDVEDE